MAIKARNPISPHGRSNAPIDPGGKGRRVGPACVTLAAWAEPVQHRGFLAGPGLNGCFSAELRSVGIHPEALKALRMAGQDPAAVSSKGATGK